MKSFTLKKILALVLALCLVLTFLPAAAAADSDSVTLTILHVNDRHGRMGADAYLSQRAKTTDGNVLILDAGDALHGQTTVNLSKGAAMTELMNEVGYSAMAIGNHEFNYGVEQLLELSQLANFPMLAANVKDTDGNLIFEAHAVYEMDGVTVGVFGLSTPETVASSDPRIMEGLVFDDPIETAMIEVAELKAAGCDIIIAITHLGLDNLTEPQLRSDALAEVEGIDVIIDGHSHSVLPEGLMVGDTLIASTGEYGNNVGVVEITIDGGVVTKTAKLIAYDDTYVVDESVTEKIAELDAVYAELTGVVVGNSPAFLQGEKAAVRTGQSSLADLVTDSMLWATGADIAFLTGGNIRASIGAGDITMGEVLTTLPYSNLLTTVDLTGADVLEMLEHGVYMYPEAVGSYIHVSGMRFIFDPSAEAGSRVLNAVLSDGTPIDSDSVYTIATIDFLAAGGDGYDMVANGTNLKYYGGDAEALVNYLATSPEISAEHDNRVSAINEGALYVVMPDATHGFLGESIRHAEDELKTLAAAGLNYKLFKTADAATQSFALDEAVCADAGAVVVWPITGEPLREAAQRVMEAGVPLIVYDRLIENFEPDSEVLGDNMKIARMAGEYFNNYFADYIAEYTESGEKINILELAGDDSTVPKQRTEGFMELAGDNVNVVERFDTQWQRAVAREQMANWLNTASKSEIESVQAIYAHEDETVLGAMDAIAVYNGDAGINIRLIIGLGGKRDVVMHTEYYKAMMGIDLVTYQFSPAMIREVIRDGANALNGAEIAAEHLIDTFEIDASTLSEYLKSDTFATRYTTAMPKVAGVADDAWYSFAVSSRAIEFYANLAASFNAENFVTESLASSVLSYSLPYTTTVVSEDTAITREQFALMLMNSLFGYNLDDVNGTLSYIDADLIDDEYTKAVDFAYRTGLMQGKGNGRFDPDGLLLAAELTAVMYNIVNACLQSACK